jgi:hypothetical protein
LTLNLLLPSAGSGEHENTIGWPRACLPFGRRLRGAVGCAALSSEDAKIALKRLQCPYVLKDKRGNVMTNLCF